MPCVRVRAPGGGLAIVCCGRGRNAPKPCATCGLIAPFLCDWKVAPGRTCDRPICDEHALEVGPDKHLCPEHQHAYKRWLDRRAAQGLLFREGDR